MSTNRRRSGLRRQFVQHQYNYNTISIKVIAYDNPSVPAVKRMDYIALTVPATSTDKVTSVNKQNNAVIINQEGATAPRIITSFDEPISPDELSPC